MLIKSILSFLGICLSPMLLAQASMPDLDSLNKEFTQLITTDLTSSEKYADSLLLTFQRQKWAEGIIHSSLMVADYQIKTGAYDSAEITIKNIITLIQKNLNSSSLVNIQALRRSYGVCYFKLCSINYDRGNYDAVLEYADQSDSIHHYFFKGQDFGQKLYRSDLLNTKTIRGAVYYVKGELNKSMKVFEEAAEIYLLDGDSRNAATSYRNLSILYKDTGQLLKAMKSLQKAEDLAKKNHLDLTLADVASLTGQLFYSMKKYKQALDYSLEAHNVYTKNGQKYWIASSAANAADNFKNLNHLDSALLYYKESLSLHKEMNNLDDIAYVLDRIASLFVKQGKYYDALVYVDEGISIVNKANLQEEKLFLNVVKAECQLELGHLDEAILIVQNLVKMAESTENIGRKKDVYDIAHKVYGRAQKFKMAYEYLGFFNQFKDSIYTEEKTFEIASTKYEYELEKETARLQVEQEREVLIYQRKLEKERWALFGVVSLSILIGLVALFAYRAYKIKTQSNIELSDKNERLKELRENEKRLSKEAINSKEKELATMAMATHEKNALLKDLEQKVSFIETRLGSEMKSSLKDMRKTISNGYALDKSWDSFIHKFEDVHPQFFDKLKGQNPVLTIDDLKLSAYLKIGMSNKEIANVTHLTLSSVKSKINRLKKKLEMGAEDSVRDYMLKYAEM